MAEEALDDMLLDMTAWQKEGKAGSSSRVASRRRGHVRDDSSDDHSDSKSENDFDEDGDYERGGSGRKGDGSKMPLKKRFESSDKDGDEEDRDSYESELSFGSDLYKDDEDRAQLAAMLEREREEILYERGVKRDNLKLRMEGNHRLKEQEVKTTRPRESGPSSRMRSSVRETRNAPQTSQKKALNELVAKKRSRDSTLTVRENNPPKSRVVESESESDGEDEDASSRDDDRSDREVSDEEERRKGEPNAEVEEIRSITIRRSKLAKWFMEPFFEDAVVGCFVRIGIGVSSSGTSIYRVCLVKNVDAKDPDKQYKFENRLTHKYLNCVWGDENSAARWQMVRASDQPPTDKEIAEMEREVERCGGRKLSKADVEEKQKKLAEVSAFVYDAKTVQEMLVLKKQATTRPSNIAVEKNRVSKELGVAESKGDHLEAERLHSRLKELEEFSLQANKSKDAKALALAAMNRRNKVENFKNASAMKPVNTDAKAGEAGYDPFSRRWTRSQNYYKTDAPKVEKESEVKEAAAEQKATAPSSETISKNRVVPPDGTTKLIALHDFDLHISLAPVQLLGGSQGAHMAYMTRKQKLEASWGAQVDSSDGRRHTLTLTVNDYKRRRGLL